ncbi:hypothetical protein SprV_0401544400 [Sparganum proliferum]
MVSQLHDGMKELATDNGVILEAFAVINGVNQGCVFRPTVFSLMFTARLTDTKCDEHSRRIHFQSCLSTATVYELLFVDDCVLNATSEGNMQRSIDLFDAACEYFRLSTNIEKTVVMQKPPPNTAHNVPQISVNGTLLQVVDNFTYLGSTLSRTTKIDDEMAHRIFKASQAFDRLKNTLWNLPGLHLKINQKMYTAVILPTLLYKTETWTVGDLKMIIPVRCFTCGKVVGDKWECYIGLLQAEYAEGDALDTLGLRRYCCRRMILSHVDLIEKLLNYAPLQK